ncbi:unnamed protein product [Cercospora beticola]|nr:unnamed protein product [Cercospora beticola]
MHEELFSFLRKSPASTSNSSWESNQPRLVSRIQKQAPSINLGEISKSCRSATIYERHRKMWRNFRYETDAEAAWRERRERDRAAEESAVSGRRRSTRASNGRRDDGAAPSLASALAVDQHEGAGEAMEVDAGGNDHDDETDDRMMVDAAFNEEANHDSESDSSDIVIPPRKRQRRRYSPADKDGKDENYDDGTIVVVKRKRISSSGMDMTEDSRSEKDAMDLDQNKDTSKTSGAGGSGSKIVFNTRKRKAPQPTKARFLDTRSAPLQTAQPLPAARSSQIHTKLDTIYDKSSNTYDLTLNVRTSPHQRHASCVEYIIDVFITPQKNPGSQSRRTKSNSDEQPRSGYLTATVIDITPETSPWKTELLLPGPNIRPLDHHTASESSHSGLGELQLTLQNIYTKAGEVRPEFFDHLDDLLPRISLAGPSNNQLLCIPEFFLHQPFRGTGLAQGVLQNILLWITTLGSPSVLFPGGTVILSPAAFRTTMEEVRGKRATDWDYVEAERKLVRSYEKSGFEVWWQGDEDRGGRAMTIMGRKV